MFFLSLNVAENKKQKAKENYLIDNFKFCFLLSDFWDLK